MDCCPFLGSYLISVVVVAWTLVAQFLQLGYIKAIEVVNVWIKAASQSERWVKPLLLISGETRFAWKIEEVQNGEIRVRRGR